MRTHSIFFVVLLVPLATLAGILTVSEGAPSTASTAVLSIMATPTPIVAPDVRVTTTNGPANEVMLAVDPTNPLHIIATAKDYTLTASTTPRCNVARVWGGLYVSFDGGATWTNGHFPGALTSDPITPASGYDCMSDPVVVFGPDGTAHFTGLLAGKHVPGLSACKVLGSDCLVEYALLYAQSRDGLTWTNSQLIWTGTSGLLGAGDSWADKNWQAVDPSDAKKVYVTWDLIAAVTPKPMLSRSLDGGATWITTPLPMQGVAGLMSPVVDADGTLYIALQGECAQRHTPSSIVCISVLRSTTGGASFLVTDAGPITGGSANTPYRTVASPYIVADHGHVFVTWAEGIYVPSSARYMQRVAIARSTDAGASFTETHLADDATSHQLMPQVAVNPAGVVGLLYYQDDASSQHNMRARFQAAQDGIGYGAAVNASSATFTPWSSYHQNGFVFMGDYLGLSAGSDGKFHAIWADTRNGRADLYATTLSMP